MRRIGVTTALVMLLAGCDQAARAEVAAMRAEMDAQREALRAMRAEVDRLTVELERERTERREGDAAREVPPPLPPAVVEEAPPVSVACTGGTCTIARAELAALVSDGAALAKAARIIPWMEGGKTAGFKLFGIRPSSPLASVGLLNGDALSEINGTKLDSIDAAAKVFADVQKLERVVLRGVRKGAPFELVVAIQ